MKQAEAGARFWGVPLERWTALKWSSPSLLFMGFGFHAAFGYGLTTLEGAVYFAGMVAMLVTYVASWLINDPAPRTTAGWRAFLLTTALMALLQVGLAGWSASNGGAGMLFMLCYVAAQVALQSPRRWVWPGVVAVLVLALAEYWLFPLETVFALMVIGVTLASCLFSRYAVEAEYRKELEAAQALEIAQERERNRMSADLHDILGHTLTGITIKADLAGRLLDAGRAEEARAHIDELTELSRTALTEIRQVVSANRVLLPEAELDSARRLIEGAGASFEATVEGLPAPGVDSTLVAHTIREAATNAVRHSVCSYVKVRVHPAGVTVVNDVAARLPLFRATGAADMSAGTGLSGLRARVGERGHLTWGQRDGQWKVELELNHE